MSRETLIAYIAVAFTCGALLVLAVYDWREARDCERVGSLRICKEAE